MLKAVGIIMIFIVVIYQITKYFTKDDPTLQENTPTQEELDNTKLAEELYNKDLRKVPEERNPPQVKPKTKQPRKKTN